MGTRVTNITQTDPPVLLETFLLPSLVPALQWLTKYSWEQEGGVEIIIKVLEKLTSPASLHGEGHPMHSTILAMMGRPLTTLLHDLHRREPSRQDIEPLLDKLRPHLDYPRTGPSQRIDMPSSHSPGLLADLRQTFRSLCLWSSPMSLSPALPTYTYRTLQQTLLLASATPVLAALLDECASQSEAGAADIALDTAASLVCANYIAQNGVESTMTLRTALSLAAQDAACIDAARRDLAVKLHRRVETQLVGVQLAPSNMQVAMPDMMPEVAMDAVPQAQQMMDMPRAEDMAAPVGEFPSVFDLDMDAEALGVQDGLGGSFNDLLGGNEDDIFDGLALDDDVDI